MVANLPPAFAGMLYFAGFLENPRSSVENPSLSATLLASVEVAAEVAQRLIVQLAKASNASRSSEAMSFGQVGSVR
ncbi:hypothetical protein AB7M16_003358 [Bradyrhizobium sp. USDA 372]